MKKIAVDSLYIASQSIFLWRHTLQKPIKTIALPGEILNTTDLSIAHARSCGIGLINYLFFAKFEEKKRVNSLDCSWAGVFPACTSSSCSSASASFHWRSCATCSRAILASSLCCWTWISGPLSSPSSSESATAIWLPPASFLASREFLSCSVVYMRSKNFLSVTSRTRHVLLLSEE